MHKIKIFCSLLTLFSALFIFSISTDAHAGADVAITHAGGDVAEQITTHDTIELTMDKSELIRLDREAASIIVGNPNHVNVLAETSKLLVIVPRAPGATHISVLDRDSNLIMQRHIIVAAPKEKYVRIRRSCAGSDDEGCLNTQTYYCPDSCHEIAPVLQESSDGADAAAGAAAESGGDIGQNGSSTQEE